GGQSVAEAARALPHLRELSKEDHAGGPGRRANAELKPPTTKGAPIPLRPALRSPKARRPSAAWSWGGGGPGLRAAADACPASLRPRASPSPRKQMMVPWRARREAPSESDRAASSPAGPFPSG